MWRNATLDHFTFGKREPGLPSTFKQRYFVCDTFWQPFADGSPGPIFFYFGNEANVELYLNNTGLMWENAPSFGALVVFAEHRYYGKSKPFSSKEIKNHMHFLTAEQAMADFAGLITELKVDRKARSSAVIGFGGSYGGMIGSWFRMKYPHLVDGVIAASAPIWSFLGEMPHVDATYFAKGTTYDASEAGGSNANCVPNVKRGWQLLKSFGATPEGRSTLHTSLRLCASAKLETETSVVGLRDWLASAWDYMAMGNFPYPSGYMLNGQGELPAYPVRVACNSLSNPESTDVELLEGMALAAGVFYNYSGDVPCFDFSSGPNPETTETADFWGYQYCTEMFQIFAKDGERDMFWEEPFNATAVSMGCEQQWGVTPRQLWATQEWGGRRIWAHSNIVFSNGLLDPWHGGGVLRDVADTVVALIIPEGAHHLDLMFSNPEDPPSVIEVRRQEREWMRIWIEEASRSRHGSDDQSIISLNLLSGGSVRDVDQLLRARKKGLARRLRSGLHREPSSCIAEPFEWLLDLIFNAFKELWISFDLAESPSQLEASTFRETSANSAL
ncbi:hypothetical protein CEUSTIGMA_g10601.t1 [Chlamydomonas eustigma]|uniref:Lysosomal Pro-X carboxypeptidase n=1 Tax=Chlamydomonas eustigma TaxID=1157962 RepID=A0A250XJB4_9CHLO|nr:hypothetical protein CEUSTIGMA_g10601.t1 [Chlamydomonas eustigma]|eukprot:GAX83175.1 hypothetical protein CEUSTIGMA_g10601.t1 [Chlamydomonas eustigma]